MSFKAIVAMLLFSVALPLLAATEVIPLNYRQAEEMLDIARSVVADQGRVSAYGNQLVINAPEPVIEELRAVVAQLDTAPKRLLITVDTQDQGTSSQSGHSIDGNVRSGDVELSTGEGRASGNQVRIIRRSTHSRNGGVQQLQVTEGYPALIQVGQTVPLTTSGTDGYGQMYRQTEYRDVLRGFYVTANVTGEQVQVTLSSSNDRADDYRPGVIHTQAADTRVTGRLGEWLTIGGVSESESGQGHGLVRRYSTQGAQDVSVRLKVEQLP